MRPLTCMKHCLKAIFNQISPDVLQNLSKEQLISFIQDILHWATKVRNRILQASILMPMGVSIVSVSHLKVLIETVEKEIHGLVASDICPLDRQNFSSFQKITSDRVLKLLQTHVPDSDATVQYLTLSRDFVQAFTDTDLAPLRRVYLAWRALFFFVRGGSG